MTLASKPYCTHLSTTKTWKAAKLLFWVGTTIASIAVCSLTHADNAAKQTISVVEQVNLSRYGGTWYEIARKPMFFQRHCARDVTATYRLNSDNTIAVINRCMDKDGEPIVAEGKAVPANASNSKLKVTFLPRWLQWLPIGKADYWIIKLDEDYQTALVGTPDKDYLWLLSRQPSVSDQVYINYRHAAHEMGYDITDFNLTKQSTSVSQPDYITLMP